jgi:hypothetical protein
MTSGYMRPVNVSTCIDLFADLNRPLSPRRETEGGKR